MTTTRRRILGAGVAATAVTAFIASTPAIAGAAPSKGNPNLTTVQLLSFNDYHGHLEASDPPLSKTPTRARPPSAAPSTSRPKLKELRATAPGGQQPHGGGR